MSIERGGRSDKEYAPYKSARRDEDNEDNEDNAQGEEEDDTEVESTKVTEGDTEPVERDTTS